MKIVIYCTGIMGIILCLSQRDIILGITFLLVSFILFLKNRHLKCGEAAYIHWTDIFSGRVIGCISMTGFSLSMLAYFYRYKYFGYGASIEDFDSIWLYYWDMLSFDYPNDMNLCFVCKSCAIIFMGLSIVFAVMDKKSMRETMLV